MRKRNMTTMFDPRRVLWGMPHHAFAFNDEPPTGAQGQPPAAQAAATDPPAEQPAFNADDYVPKDRVTQLIQENKNRAKQSALTEFNQQLEQLGITGGLEGLQQTMQQRQQAERERLEQANEYKTLYEQVKAEKDQVIAEKDEALRRTQQTYQNERKNNALLNAARNTVNPQQVASLVADRVKLDEQGQPYVIDELGSRMTDGNGNVLTLEGYVERFLDQHTYFRKPAGGRGTTTVQSGNNPPPPPRGGQGVDLARASKDDAYFRENKAEIERMIRSGELG